LGLLHLSPSGPPFDPWTVSTEPTDVYRPAIDSPDDPLFALDMDFIEEQDWSLLFDVDKKGEKYLELETTWRPWRILGVVYSTYVFLFKKHLGMYNSMTLDL